MIKAPTDLNASLSSLAMLSTNLKAGKDYLDYLHGFVVDVISRLNGTPFDAATIQKGVSEQFGLKIPAATFSIYLKRLVKAGVVTPLATGLQFSAAKLPATNIDTERSVFHKRVTDLTDSLAGFAHQRYSLVWDEQVNLHIILQKLERTYAAEAQQKLESAQAEHEATRKALEHVKWMASQQADGLADAAAREEKLKAESAARAKELEDLRRSQAAALEKETKRRKRIEKSAKRIAMGAYILAWILFAVCTAVAFFTTNRWFGLPAAVLGLFNIAAGFSGGTIRRVVRSNVEALLLRLDE